MRDSEREPFYDDKTPSTGWGSECVSRCTSVYTTWHLDTCRHSANLCPAFLVAVTYAQLVVVNWTSPVSNCPRTGDGRLLYAGPTSWNSLPDNLKNVNLSLQSFKRHLKTLFFSSYLHTSARLRFLIKTRYINSLLLLLLYRTRNSKYEKSVRPVRFEHERVNHSAT